MKNLIPYVITFGLGIVGGLLIPKPAPTPPAAVPTAPPNNPNGILKAATTCRWTSGYHGPINGIYPGASVAEALYPYGQRHKITQLSSSLYSAGGAPGADTNGSTIFVD